MGFLYHMLKDVSEKQPYNVGKIELTEIVKLLEPKLSTGREGFSVIGTVARRVREYNKFVKNSNDSVKSVITKMSENMTALKKTVSKILQNNADSDDSAEVKQAETKVTMLAEEYAKKEKQSWSKGSKAEPIQQFKDLNADLRLKITHASKNITHEAERLTTLSKKQKDNLDEMIALIKRTCGTLKKCVKDKIRDDVNALVKNLTHKVQKIFDELNKIRQKLEASVENLRKWIRDADETAVGGMKQAKRIEEKEGIAWPYKDDINDAVKNINDAFILAKNNVKQKVEEAIRAVAKMDEELKKDLFKVKTAINDGIRNVIEEVAGEVNSEITSRGQSAVKVFKQAMESLHGEISTLKNGNFSVLQSSVQTQLTLPAQTVQEEIENVISEHNSKIIETLKTLNSNVLNLTVQFIEAQADELKNRIDRYLESMPDRIKRINGNAVEGFKSGIQGLIRSIHHDQTQQNIESCERELELLRSQASQAMNSAAKLWQQDIDGELLKLHTEVNKLRKASKVEEIQSTLHKLCRPLDELKTLVTCLGHDEWEMQLNQRIREVHSIRLQVDEAINKGCSTPPTTHQLTPELRQGLNNILSAYQAAVQMSKELGVNFRAAQSSHRSTSYTSVANISKFSQLLMRFDSHIKSTVSKLYSDSGFERNGIQAQLEDLRKNIATLKNAISRVEGNVTIVESALSGWISKASKELEQAKQTADEATTALAVQMQAKVKEATSNIQKKVAEQLKNGSNGNEVSIEGSAGFSLYKKHVTQTTGALSALASGTLDKISEKSGTLPSKIKDIDTHGLTTLRNLLNGETSVSSRGFLDQITDNLTNLLKEFSTAGQYVNKYLNELKTNIGKDKSNGLNEIKNKLKLLITVEVEAATKLANDFLNGADRLRDKYVSQIHQYVAEQSSCATRDINTQVCKQYVSIIQDLLSEFVNKVQSELGPLPNEITADAGKVYKGFMGLLQHKLTASRLNVQLDDSATLQTLSARAKTFFTDLPRTLNTKPKIMPSDNLSKLQNRLAPLFTDLTKYDSKCVTNLDALHTLLTEMRPESYAHHNNPLLQILNRGITDLHDELGRAYISAYDSETFNGELVKNVQHVSSTNDVNVKYDLTDEGTRLSKVFLTVLRTLDVSLHTLKSNCKSLPKKRINRDTDIGKLLTEMGYVVSNLDEQNGELQDKSDMTGEHILGLLIGHSKKIYSSHNDKNYEGALKDLVTYLKHYFEVCHYQIRPNAQAPTTVYQMLHWLAGFHYNPMYSKVRDYFLELFGNKFPTKFQIVFPPRTSKTMAIPVNLPHMQERLDDVTLNSYYVLVAICGHGYDNLGSRYACDFNTNPDGLDYPTSTSKCFELLVEVCMRLNQQLFFLCKQCHNGQVSGGWADCWYGQGVGGSAWTCNEKQYPEQRADQNHKQSCNQKCNQTANCGLKSPLQSFLEDGLQGFLPHPVKAVGCGVTCSLSNHRGMPCKTPMGFKDLSIAASRSQNGTHIRNVLDPFCGITQSAMGLLCAYFLCLMRRPPQTLCDMFTFYYTYLEHWRGRDGSSPDVQKHKKEAFQQAVADANFGRSYEALNPASILTTSEHNTADEIKPHDKGDLFSLLSCNPDSTPPPPCGQYLQPMSWNARSMFTEKHAANYVSWIVYITESFYDLLKKLYDECEARCGGEKPKCRISKCEDACNTKQYPGAHAVNHQPSCKSIVQCPDTHPTLYKYGFTFGSPYKLSGTGNSIGHKRTCKDFCKALEKVVGKGSLILGLIESIDEFLWAIRTPFSYLVLALWSASFLYLLYVYIGRLDTLHIRSHLRIPASHKISAQSLLAASRIGKLAKISYLQP